MGIASLNPSCFCVIPNECEGSKTYFSLRSKQGFLAESVLSIAEGLEMTPEINGTAFPILRRRLSREARILLVECAGIVIDCASLKRERAKGVTDG